MVCQGWYTLVRALTSTFLDELDSGTSSMILMPYCINAHVFEWVNLHNHVLKGNGKPSKKIGVYWIKSVFNKHIWVRLAKSLHIFVGTVGVLPHLQVKKYIFKKRYKEWFLLL